MPELCTFEVERPGMISLVQDKGRPGYQQFGVPSGGVLDRRAAALANWLVGNPVDTPVLEIALAGPQLRTTGTCQIAITGADLSAHLNGERIPMHSTVSVPHDAVLTFGKNNGGCRTYLAIGGSWMVKPWLGSATATPYDPSLTPESDLRNVERLGIRRSARIAPRKYPHLPSWPSSGFRVRVLPGPEFQSFPAGAIADFSGRPFTASSTLNRMGIRMEESIEVSTGLEVISSGIVPGTIQITHAGHPVVLLADAQTSGGYPRIANIISADLDILAQIVPGDTLSFVMTNREAAVAAYRAYLQTMKFA